MKRGLLIVAVVVGSAVGLWRLTAESPVPPPAAQSDSTSPAPRDVTNETSNARPQQDAAVEPSSVVSGKTNELGVAPSGENRRTKMPINAGSLEADFSAALASAGRVGEHVVGVDCSEPPCIIFGLGHVDRGDVEALKETPDFQPYRDLQHVALDAPCTKPDGCFAVATFDETFELTDAARARLEERVAQLARSRIP